MISQEAHKSIWLRRRFCFSSLWPNCISLFIIIDINSCQIEWAIKISCWTFTKLENVQDILFFSFLLPISLINLYSIQNKYSVKSIYISIHKMLKVEVDDEKLNKYKFIQTLMTITTCWKLFWLYASAEVILPPFLLLLSPYNIHFTLLC